MLLSDLQWVLSPRTEPPFDVPIGGIPALVPGDVHDDLERAGLLMPNGVGMGDPNWIAVSEVGWRYQTTFTMPDVGEGHRVWLDFDGVDFACQVQVGGVQVGGNSGMFRGFSLEITHVASPGKDTSLQVDIEAMPNGIGRALKAADGALSDAGGPDFFVFVNNQIRRELKDLKSPTAGSYDWAVNTWCVGIWRDVRLRVTGPARITDVRVDVVCHDSSAQLVTEFTLADPVDVGHVAQVTVRDPAGSVVAEATDVQVPAGSLGAEATLVVPDPLLWWPVGYGDQPLYTVTVEVAPLGGHLSSDSNSRRVGIRQVVWKQVDGADADFINPFRLVVNGTTIRTMGSCLLPPDLLYGRIGRHGTWLLHAAAAAGFNTLRIWGGGVLLPDAMYDLADELGIMLLQEFFLANCSPESDPEFLENLDLTVRNVIRHIRHHPSIIEWGGGNEMHWLQGDDHPALQIMRDAVADEDTRIFRATCPMQGSRHSPWHFDPDTSYAHYDDLALTDNLGSAPLMRYGEFGAPSPSHLEVWERDIPIESRWPIDGSSDEVLIRKNVFSAAFGEEFWLMRSLVEGLFGLSRSLRDLIRAGQFLGAEGVRYSIDALRRRGRSLGGFTTWDFNEPWSNGAGSFLVDFDGRPLMSYSFAQQAMTPVALSLRLDGILFPPGQRVELPVVLTSDAAEAVANLTWSAVVYEIDGSILHRTSGGQDVLEPLDVVDSGVIVFEMPADASPVIVHLSLSQSSDRLVERVQIIGARGAAAPLSALLPDDRYPGPTEIVEAGLSPANDVNLAAARNGGRIRAISGVEQRDQDPSIALIDGTYASGPDGYRGIGAWRSTTERGWIELELARLASVSRLCLGRDRSGSEHDRTLDKLRIEVSTDGDQWTSVCEFTQLAPLLGDRLDTNPPRDPKDSPVWTLDLRFPAVMARYIRLEVRGRRGAREHVALDEIEVYEDQAVDVSEPTALVRDHRESGHQLARTTLSGEIVRTGTTRSGLESLTLRVRNTGAVIALFCDVVSADAYRPRALADFGAVSIPPGEYREITLTTDPALSGPIRSGTWQVSAWNADPTQAV